MNLLLVFESEQVIRMLWFLTFLCILPLANIAISIGMLVHLRRSNRKLDLIHGAVEGLHHGTFKTVPPAPPKSTPAGAD